MAQVGRIELRSGNKAPNAAAILACSGFVGVDLKVKRVRTCILTNLMRLQVSLDKFVSFVAILDTECDIQVAGKTDINGYCEVRIERNLVGDQVTRTK